MSGNTLPHDLDLLNLFWVSPRPRYVIINGRRRPRITTTTEAPQPPSPRPEFGVVTFVSGRSYLRLPQWSPGRRGRVEFSFKTMQRNGVMMVTSPSDSGHRDFFAVELSDGDLYAVFNLGGQTQRFLMGADINDGQRHDVVIERVGGRALRFTIDGLTHEDHLSIGDDGSLDLGSTFFVGGTPNPEHLPWLLYSRRRDFFYRGCLWDLKFDGGHVVELQQVYRDQRMHGVDDGCAEMRDQCSRTPCEHGDCRRLWADHVCYCALTTYTGSRCQRGQLARPLSLSLSLSLSLVLTAIFQVNLG